MEQLVDVCWILQEGSPAWETLPLGITGGWDDGWGYRLATLHLSTSQVRRLLESSLSEVRHGAYTIYIRRSTLPISRVVADLDGTLTRGEGLVWLARTKEVEQQMEALTEACMLGQVSFAESFEHRLDLLSPITADEWISVAQAMPLADGAEAFRLMLEARGIAFDCASGGVEPFVAGLQARLGYECYVCSRQGQYILDGIGKQSFACHDPRPVPHPQEQTLTIGDGANDLDMLASSGHALLYSAMSVEAYPLDKLMARILTFAE